jgi:AcrR family transcriptional regulator
MTELRADAQRNRERLIAAGTVLFAQHGLDISLEEIARHAGVGTMTAYRRFPDKEDLIDAVFARQVDEFAELSEAAVTDPDPWEALNKILEAVLAMEASNRGFRQLLHDPHGGPEITRRRARITKAVAILVTRAKKAGQLRPDATSSDLVIVLLMVGTVGDRMRDTNPDAWRRYLSIVLDGLRHDPGRSRQLTPRAPATAQVEAAMHSPHDHPDAGATS